MLPGTFFIFMPYGPACPITLDRASAARVAVFPFFFSQFKMFCLVCSFASPKDPLHAGAVCSLTKHSITYLSSNTLLAGCFISINSSHRWCFVFFRFRVTLASSLLYITCSYLVSSSLGTTAFCCLSRYRCFLIDLSYIVATSIHLYLYELGQPSNCQRGRLAMPRSILRIWVWFLDTMLIMHQPTNWKPAFLIFFVFVREIWPK